MLSVSQKRSSEPSTLFELKFNSRWGQCHTGPSKIVQNDPACTICQLLSRYSTLAMDTKPPLTPEPPQIALHFSCANLSGRRFSRTLNHIVIQLHFYDPISGKWRVRAQTDVGSGDSPVFSKAITMDYFFKYNSLFRAEVYDTGNGDVSGQRLIGSVVFSSHALVTSPGGTLSAPLTKARQRMLLFFMASLACLRSIHSDPRISLGP